MIGSFPGAGPVALLTVCLSAPAFVAPPVMALKVIMADRTFDISGTVLAMGTACSLYFLAAGTYLLWARSFPL